MGLSLFQDLLVRVFVIVLVMDVLILYFPRPPQIYLIFVLEIAVLFISIWFDLKVRKWKK